MALVHRANDVGSSVMKEIPAYTLKVNMGEALIEAIVDTGSPISLVVEGVLQGKPLTPVVSEHGYRGINNSPLVILDSICTTLLVEGIHVDILFYVIPKETMSYNMLLGRNFIAHKAFIFEFGDTLTLKYLQ